MCPGFLLEMLQKELMTFMNTIEKSNAGCVFTLYIVKFSINCHFFVRNICLYGKKALSSRRENEKPVSDGGSSQPVP
jgi:hypothetical protein